MTCFIVLLLALAFFSVRSPRGTFGGLISLTGGLICGTLYLLVAFVIFFVLSFF
jgi:hypothetical protein